MQNENIYERCSVAVRFELHLGQRFNMNHKSNLFHIYTFIAVRDFHFSGL
jgi:hypothetical protein